VALREALGPAADVHCVLQQRCCGHAARCIVVLQRSLWSCAEVHCGLQQRCIVVLQQKCIVPCKGIVILQQMCIVGPAARGAFVALREGFGPERCALWSYAEVLLVMQQRCIVVLQSACDCSRGALWSCSRSPLL